MSDQSPFPFVWTDEGCMRPPGNYWPVQADKRFVVGMQYRLVEFHDRSETSHRHYFAALHDAWQSLSDEQVERFPTSEHLRKWALIKAGYADERSIVGASKAEAQRIAAFVKPMDDYAVVTAKDAVVTVYTAKSQSMKAMGKRDFEESKQAVLGIVSEMIGVKPDELRRQAGQAA
jgi:hypothetical protein